MHSVHLLITAALFHSDSWASFVKIGHYLVIKLGDLSPNSITSICCGFVVQQTNPLPVVEDLLFNQVHSQDRIALTLCQCLKKPGTHYYAS